MQSHDSKGEITGDPEVPRQLDPGSGRDCDEFFDSYQVENDRRAESFWGGATMAWQESGDGWKLELEMSGIASSGTDLEAVAWEFAALKERVEMISSAAQERRSL